MCFLATLIFKKDDSHQFIKSLTTGPWSVSSLLRRDTLPFMAAIFTEVNLIVSNIISVMKKKNFPNANLQDITMVHLPCYTLILFYLIRGSGMQNGSICADHSHSHRDLDNDLHRHREVPRNCVSTQNEEAVHIQESLQNAR